MTDFVLAMSRFKRHRYKESLQVLDSLLEKNCRDKAAFQLKLNSLNQIEKDEELDLEEQDLADIMLDETQRQSMVRPGTSFGQATGQVMPCTSRRQVGNDGRLMTGFIRPGTANLQNMQNRGGETGRMMSSYGRQIRLNTASLVGRRGEFISTDKINVKQIAQKDQVARAIEDYLLFVAKDTVKALELAAEATQVKQYSDWWWKDRLARCYYRMGMLKDAEKQLQSLLRRPNPPYQSLSNEEAMQQQLLSNQQSNINCYLMLAKVYERMDQPNSALDTLRLALTVFPNASEVNLRIARVHDQLHSLDTSIEFYRKVLQQDSTCLEALAQVGHFHFCQEQYEVALRFYKRLLQLGIQSAALYNNLALCCFYNQQFDLFQHCVSMSLQLADDDAERSQIYYNLSHVFYSLGENNKAYQCLQLALSFDKSNAQAANNLAILEGKRNNRPQAKYYYNQATRQNPFLLEPLFNLALHSHQASNHHAALLFVDKALAIDPSYSRAKDLRLLLLSMMAFQ